MVVVMFSVSEDRAMLTYAPPTVQAFHISCFLNYMICKNTVFADLFFSCCMQRCAHSLFCAHSVLRAIVHTWWETHGQPLTQDCTHQSCYSTHVDPRDSSHTFFWHCSVKACMISLTGYECLDKPFNSFILKNVLALSIAPKSIFCMAGAAEITVTHYPPQNAT